RRAVAEIEAAPCKHLSAGGDPEPLSGIRGSLHRADVEDAHLGRGAGLRRLREVRSLAALTKRTPETVGGTVPHRQPVLPDHGLADRAPGHAVAIHQLRFTRHHVTGLEHTRPDLLHDLVRDLHVPRPGPAPLYRSSHSPSTPPMLLYMSQPQEATSTPLHSVSVAGVVVREDGRLLAIRRADNGTWELPGGVLELNETPEAGVAREVWEETGIHVEVDE